MGIDWDSISGFQWFTALFAAYATVLSTLVFFARRRDRKHDREERLSLRIDLEVSGPKPRNGLVLIVRVFNDSLFSVFLDHVRFDRPRFLPPTDSTPEQLRGFDWEVESEWNRSSRQSEMRNGEIVSKDDRGFRFRWEPGSSETVRRIPDRVLAFEAMTKGGTTVVLKGKQIKARVIEGLEL